jgi:hypothetical protein
MTTYLQWFRKSARLPHTRDAIRRLYDEIKRWNPEIESDGVYGAFASE